MTAFNIPIWAETTSTRDPSTHYWTNLDSEKPIRICTGEKRPDLPLRVYDVVAPCSICTDLFVEDLVRGEQRFERLADTPLDQQRTHVKVKDTHLKYGGILLKHRDTDMEIPAIRMTSFAEFHDTSRSRRATMVRNLREQYLQPEMYRYRNYYHQIRNCMVQCHWQTNEVQVFADAYEHLNFNPRYPQKRDSAMDIAEHFMRHWEKEGESIFEVSHGGGELGRLPLRIAPDVGVKTKNGDYLAAKLWFKHDKPKRAYRQAFHWMADQFRPPTWNQDWQPAIWDVRRQTFLQPLRPPKDIRLNLIGDAAAFIGMWDALGE